MTRTSPAPSRSEAQINAQLDALSSQERPRDEKAMHDFALETHEFMNAEAFDPAEQAAWEGRMCVNMVLDPVPVRVDARMRPVAG